MHRTIRPVIHASVVALLSFASAAMATTPRLPTEARVEKLLSQMTLAEKIGLLGGAPSGFDTLEIPRLGIPALHMSDGPLGVRSTPMTALPAGIAMGATFDPELVGVASSSIAEEARFSGKNMLLGPCVNLSRTPFGGRNFESFGEDPYLTSQLAGSYVKGVQSQHILSSVKHFALNEQETNRTTINVIADPRTMFEMHLPAFKAAIDAGSWTVMASYNKVLGHYSSENDLLLNQILKGLWNFQGFVVSDWGAVHSTIPAALAGLDLEMPTAEFFAAPLLQAVQAGSVPQSLIDDKVKRILRAMVASGLMDAPTLPPANGPTSAEHRAAALQLAREGTVLLKNEGEVLPLNLHVVKSVAVIGPNADAIRSGRGSSRVLPAHVVTPLQGLSDRLGSSMQIHYAQGNRLAGDMTIVPSEFLHPSTDRGQHGLTGEYFNGKDLSGTPILTRLDPQLDFNFILNPPNGQLDNFSVRWTGYLEVPVSGLFEIVTRSDDGVRMFINDQEIINDWTDHGATADTAKVQLSAGQLYAVRIEYYQGGQDAVLQLGWNEPSEDLLAQAVTAAKSSDVAIVFAGTGNELEGEEVDRASLSLPDGQDALITAVASSNPNTIVVLNSGTPILMPWLPKVKAVLYAWFPGQEGGTALAEIIAGDVNPSGKSPITFLKRWEDSSAYGNYPGENGNVTYSEGVFLGYRHMDQAKITPLFPFGHGLSYTKFVYSHLKLQIRDPHAKSPKIDLSFDLTNAGLRSGSEVAQVYVGEDHPVLTRPVRELKGFVRQSLQAGETQHEHLTLDASSFAYYDANTQLWTVNPGTFHIWVGASSRDLRLHEGVMLR